MTRSFMVLVHSIVALSIGSFVTPKEAGRHDHNLLKSQRVPEVAMPPTQAPIVDTKAKIVVFIFIKKI